MRVGNNPLAGRPAPHVLAPVVFLVAVHLPGLYTAYHKNRLEVIQTCLTSMTQNANTEYSLIVWDNGSIPEVRVWIEDMIRPDIYVTSKNVGKSAARKAMLNMISPDSIACYSDDDIYYYPDWFIPQKELLEHFPNVACVSGYAVRTSFRWGNENTKRWAKKNALLEMGKLIPKQHEDDFALSVGRTPDFQADYTKMDFDYRITYKNKQAYATSHHCQVIGYARTLARATQIDYDAMGDEKVFDIALDKLGLRLATINRLARHIGNVLDEDFKKQIKLETLQGQR